MYNRNTIRPKCYGSTTDSKPVSVGSTPTGCATVNLRKHENHGIVDTWTKVRRLKNNSIESIKGNQPRVVYGRSTKHCRCFRESSNLFAGTLWVGLNRLSYMQTESADSNNISTVNRLWCKGKHGKFGTSRTGFEYLLSDARLAYMARCSSGLWMFL